MLLIIKNIVIRVATAIFVVRGPSTRTNSGYYLLSVAKFISIEYSSQICEQAKVAVGQIRRIRWMVVILS